MQNDFIKTENISLLTQAQKNAQAWLGPDFDEDTKNEVKKLLADPDENELISAFARPMEFGTAGLRGEVGIGIGRMNSYTVAMATMAVATHLTSTIKKKPSEIKVAVAFDGRKDSREFSKIVASILLGKGICVYYFPQVQPTPLLAFTVRNKNLDFGIMVTASHNPRPYNGYKVYSHYGGQIISPTDTQISSIIKSSIESQKWPSPKKWSHTDISNKPGLLEMGDTEIDEYVQWLLTFAEKKQENSQLNVVYSALGGSAGSLALKTFTECNFTNVSVVSKEQNPDPEFAGLLAPNPENAHNFKRALELATSINAELVLANDGDGDRLGVYVKENDQYTYLNGNRIGSLLAWYSIMQLQSKNALQGNEMIISTIVSSPQIKEIADYFGLPFSETLTGFKWMGAIAQKAENFLFAYEEAYGYCIRGRDKDGLSAANILCNAAINYRKKGGILGLMNEIEEKIGIFEEGYAENICRTPDGKKIMDDIVESIRNKLPNQLSQETLAGVKMLEIRDIFRSKRINEKGSFAETLPTQNLLHFKAIDGSWLAIRPSGTEPKIKAYFGVSFSIAEREKVKPRLEALRNQAKKMLSV